MADRGLTRGVRYEEIATLCFRVLSCLSWTLHRRLLVQQAAMECGGRAGASLGRAFAATPLLGTVEIPWMDPSSILVLLLLPASGAGF